MKRFYCPPENVEKDKICIDGKNSHYIKNVLRLNKGDKIEIFDGKGNKYNCVLQDLNAARIVSKEFSLAKETAYSVILAQAIPNKPAKMDFVIEKATELGVDAIIPLDAGHSVGAGRDLPLHKLQRWQKIACEASKQCGRPVVPEIKEVLSVNQAISVLKNSDIKIFPCIDKDTIMLRDVLNVGAGLKPAPTFAVFIGPEGDFTPDEISVAKENDFRLVSLGERVLRTETAGLYILSILDYVFG